MRKLGRTWLLHLVLVAMSFMLVLPFVWLLLTSVKPLKEVGTGNWIPTRSAVLEEGQVSDEVLEELRDQVLNGDSALATLLADAIDFESKDLNRESLANQLTQRVIEGEAGSIYTPERFANVTLSEETQRLPGAIEAAQKKIPPLQKAADAARAALQRAEATVTAAEEKVAEAEQRDADPASAEAELKAAMEQRQVAADAKVEADKDLADAVAAHQLQVQLYNGWLLHDAFPDLIDHPRRFRWYNYLEVFRQIPFGRYYMNSIFVAAWVTLLQVFTSSLAAFAFSRLDWPGRDKVFLLYLSTMMLPGLVMMIPNYQIMISLGWVDRFVGLIIPAAFTAFGTFLLRQFMLTIPRAMDEAAEIDGASKWRVYWDVILPMTRPGLITLAIFTFMGNYHSFFWPLVMLKTQERYTLPIGLLHFDSTAGQETNLLMAAVAMSVIPMVIVFVLLQKYLVKGIQLGAVKG